MCDNDDDDDDSMLLSVLYHNPVLATSDSSWLVDYSLNWPVDRKNIL